MGIKTFNNVKLNISFTKPENHATNIASGDNISDSIGKIAKWYDDFHSVVWDGNASKVNNHTVESNVPANAKFTDTTYTVATESKLGLIKNGGDITVDSTGVVTVKDNSHDHTIANVTGLQSALDSKINNSKIGVASGVASLDENGFVPSSQLPSYVDDAIEGYLNAGKFYKESTHTTQITGESGKIYIDLSTNKCYRWGGSTFVEISSSIALGTTSSTAFRGDQGKKAYDHSQLVSGNPHNVTKTDVGLDNVENKSAATILGEMSSTNVIDALGYTPPPDTTATTSKNGLMSSADKTKLNGIAAGAEVNQNAISIIKVGDVTVASNTKEDTFEIVAGNNVTLTANATTKKITISSKDTVYTLPTATSSVLGGIKVGGNLSIASGVLSAKTLKGSTASTDGTSGYAPAPTKSGFTEYTTVNNQFLCGDGTWSNKPVIEEDTLILNCVAG